MAQLERLGVLYGIITQNIDNLHQEAGSACVVEFHGNGRRLQCPTCSSCYLGAERDTLGMPPRCGCGRILKPGIVFFEETIPNDVLAAAVQLTRTCGVMLVVGTSATVAPAAMFPHLAHAGGALLAEFNVGPTELTEACDAAIFGDVAVTLPMLARRVQELLG